VTRSISQLAAAVAALLVLGACTQEPDPFAVSFAPSEPDLPGERFSIPAGARAGGAETATAGPATLVEELSLFGRVGFDLEHRVAVVARVDGVVTATGAVLGDEVIAGERLVQLESRELSRLRTSLVEARYGVAYAGTRLERELDLWERQLTSAEALATARYAVHAAELELGGITKQLLALGESPEELASLDVEGVTDLTPWTAYEVLSPGGGRVLEKSVVLGQAVEAGDLLYELADLTKVWVDLVVPARELARIALEQPVLVEASGTDHEQGGRVSFLDPTVDANSQKGMARVELENPDGAWRPGMFVGVRVRLGSHEAGVCVPEAAVFELLGEARVFVKRGGVEWEAREVELGARSGGLVEVLAGLAAGERVATTEGLTLKAVWLGQGGLEE